LLLCNQNQDSVYRKSLAPGKDDSGLDADYIAATSHGEIAKS